jgi:hypothetical protein
MTENASGRTPTLTDHERTVWGVNYQVQMDRHDLAAELADPAALESGTATPAPVDRGTRAAHRVALRRRAYRR